MAKRKTNTITDAHVEQARENLAQVKAFHPTSASARAMRQLNIDQLEAWLEKHG